MSSEPIPVFFEPQRSAWREYGRPALLFVLTAVCVYFHGGVQLVVAALSILVAHEMGHYVACRYYGVDATLPHFLPAPPPVGLIGTFGAFIRIRGPIPHRRALFDIGMAGPIAGFLVCLPVLYLATQEITPVPDDPNGIMLNEPLLFGWAVRAFSTVVIPEGMVPAIGPYGMAAWFGLFLTGLNLLPIGQLDGGHGVYAIFRQRAWQVSRIASWVCVALVVLSPSWIVWLILLRFIGRPHPPTIYDELPLGRARVFVGALCLLMFVACFVPNPIASSWGDTFALFRELFAT